MTSDTLFDRWCGGASIVAGAITAVFWFIHPDPGLSDLQASKTAIWPVAHVLFIITLICTIFALAGLQKRHGAALGIAGFVGFALAMIGTPLFVGAGIFDGFVKPLIVGGPAEDLLKPQGPIEMAILPLVMPGGLMFGIGFVTIGVQIIRTNAMPKWVGVLFLFGMILGLSPLMPPVVRMAGCAAFGGALIMHGIDLIKGSENPVANA